MQSTMPVVASLSAGTGDHPGQQRSLISTTKSNIKQSSLVVSGSSDDLDYQFTGKPIPGIDVVVKKNPGGSALVAGPRPGSPGPQRSLISTTKSNIKQNDGK